jgi:uracil-DNA glycosylase
MQLIQADSWQELMNKEMAQSYWPELVQFVSCEYQNRQCFPPQDQIFSAFELTPLDQVKVVILGQDPYHGPGQAHGLAFSVPEGVPKPPSLVNILKEVYQEDLNALGKDSSKNTSGDLTHWAEQGVLLLNTVLTVSSGQAGSHQRMGWEHFTNAVIKEINDQISGVVFMLWGRFAQQKIKLIDTSKHLVLSSGHPSPLSANRGLWFGCDHFNKANDYLNQNGQVRINWCV